MFSKHFLNNQKGQLTLSVLLFSFVAIIILSGLIIWVDVNLKSAYRSIHRDSAFRIAEAGIEYYRWHLAHAPLDFQDGTSGPGPYVHDFKDSSGVVIGRFNLSIAPPQSGSTVVAVESTGFLLDNPNRKRKIAVKFGIPSLSSYAVVANDVDRK